MSTLRLHQHLRLNAVAVLMPALAACAPPAIKANAATSTNFRIAIPFMV